MKKPLYIFSLLILLIAAFLAGNRFNQRGAGSGEADSGERRILHYVDPMNPAHTTKEPGIAPCGMPMEPVYADDDTSSGSGAAGLSTSLGLVRVNQQKQQIIGVQTGEVARSAETSTIRALGRIAADENRIYTLIAATDGWVGEVHESTTGSLVDKNQLMAHIKILDYDFFTWQRRYLTDQSNVGRRRAFNSPSSGADQMSEEIPIGRQAGSPHSETGAPATMPQAATPQVTAAGQTPPGAELPAHPAAHATAPTPSPPADMPPMETPQSSPGTGEMPASAAPGSMPQAGDAQTGLPHHSDKAPVLMKKRATLPEAARRGQERIVVRESDGGLGFASEEDSFSASRARLELLKLGVGENQLAGLSKSRAYITFAELRSPVSGLVLSRNVSPRQKIDRGTECFRIADLSTVWVEADLYDNEVRYIQPGTQARISMPNQKEHFAARVSEILPRFDAASRTLKVRLEMDNPGNVFRPDMFVDVEFLVALPESIAVPSGALIDSGKSKIVYVVIEDGVFEPRGVATGWRFNDRVEIVEGLKPGEKIVVSGNFLIDSESRMKLAAARLMEDTVEKSPDGPMPAGAAASEPQTTMPVMQKAAAEGKAKDPVCGMSVDQDKAMADGLTVEAEGKTHYFCSADCREQFKQDPFRYLAEKAGKQVQTTQPAIQQAATAAKAKDPICGMTVDQDKARTAGLFAAVQGKTYYFCSEECKEEFHRHGPQPGFSAGADPGPEASSGHGRQVMDRKHAEPADTPTMQDQQHSPEKQMPADAPGDGEHDHD
jgi:YHS domain-containing protein/multidrug efflux pump subunit AcrA (membrane-fusion protein)